MYILKIVHRFFDEEEGGVVSRFWDLCQVFESEKSTDAKAATAEHLFNLIKTSLKK